MDHLYLVHFEEINKRALLLLQDDSTDPIGNHQDCPMHIVIHKDLGPNTKEVLVMDQEGLYFTLWFLIRVHFVIVGVGTLDCIMHIVLWMRKFLCVIPVLRRKQGVAVTHAFRLAELHHGDLFLFLDLAVVPGVLPCATHDGELSQPCYEVPSD